MAYTESATVQSFPSATTFAESAKYKFVEWTSTGGGVRVVANTGDTKPMGVLYGITSTTNSGQAVPVATAGVVKVQMAASTLAAGDIIAASSAGLGIAATTDAHEVGVIVSGSSGPAGRIVSVLLKGYGPLG